MHGYGADGNDLLGLAEQWRAVLPEAAFVLPHAPEPFEGASFGRQWFPLQGRTLEDHAHGVARAGAALDRAIDAELAAHGIDDSHLALGGFSQGAMLALHVGLHRKQQIAGILSYSGLLALAPGSLARLRPRPPILLVHGEEDQVIPVAALDAARATLQAAGFPVAAHRRAGLPHGIDPHGVELGAAFLRRIFAA
jgi:phospholipase/carboxylesterase